MAAPPALVMLFGAAPEPAPGEPASAAVDAAQARSSGAGAVAEWTAPRPGWVYTLGPDEPDAARIEIHRRLEGEPTERWRSAIDVLRRGQAAGAVAIALPAARRVIGAAALAPLLAAATEGSRGRLNLFVRIDIEVRGDRVAARTRGMAYLGGPDLVCEARLAERDMAVKLLQGGMAQMMADGPEALRPGSLVEATEADGRWIGRFRVAPPEADDSGDGGVVLPLVPVPGGPSTAARSGVASAPGADPWAALAPCLGAGRRAADLDLRTALLAGLDLNGLAADRLDLSHADLCGASLRDSRFSACRLSKAQLLGLDAAGAVWRDCVLDDAHAAGAGFAGGRIEDCSAAGADLRAADLRRAGLSETRFERAVLRDAVLDGATGDGVVFRGADLRGARLVGVDFEDADFRGADLRGADLSRGRFRHADFRGALLDDAMPPDADFSGARLDRDAGPSPSVAARPVGKARGDPAFDRLWSDVLGEVGRGGVPSSARLADLLTRAGALAASDAGLPAARLHRLLERIQGGPAPADGPDALLGECRRMLEEELPELGRMLGDADWHAMLDLVARVRPGGNSPERPG